MEDCQPEGLEAEEEENQDHRQDQEEEHLEERGEEVMNGHADRPRTR